MLVEEGGVPPPKALTVDVFTKDDCPPFTDTEPPHPPEPAPTTTAETDVTPVGAIQEYVPAVV
jgi:hypothetical protein